MVFLLQLLIFQEVPLKQGTRVITLINGEDIADLVAKYKLHVREVTTYELGDFLSYRGLDG